jgi:hypothetical protein
MVDYQVCCSICGKDMKVEARSMEEIPDRPICNDCVNCDNCKSRACERKEAGPWKR